MSSQPEVEVAQQEGRPVIRKRAADQACAVRLEREAVRLEAARHPGVVSMLGHEPLVLTLAWAGDRTLETHRPALPAAAALLAAVAETVADLHDLEIVHGRLTADHVVIDRHGRPRLCGLAGAEPDHEQPTPLDDVAALGRLVELLVGIGAEAEPIPERRWARRRWTGYQRRSLQNLADQATDPDPSHRPTARTLAAALAAVAPDARLVDPAAPEPEVAHDTDPLAEAPAAETGPSIDDGFAAVDQFLGMRVADDDLGRRAPLADEGRPDRCEAPPTVSRAVASGRSRRHRPARARAAVAGAVLLVLLAVLVMRPTPTSTGQADDTAPALTTATTTDAVARSVTTSASDPALEGGAAPVRGDCATVASPSADVDGDRCPDPIVVTGSTIQAGAVRYHLGAEGDDITVGDWDCDGQATPALVRPSTGEVFVFTRWATAAEPLSVNPTAVVAPGSVPVPNDRCGPLRVQAASGSVTTITTDHP